MKLLITGATGYLGGVIVREAVRKGYDIRVMVRDVDGNHNLPDKTEICQGDLLDIKSLLKALEGCEAAIHSAGLVSIWRKNPFDFYQINVLGTENLLRAAREKKVSRVVYTSSFFALGPTNATPADETWNNPIEFYPTDYARSKADADRKVREFARNGFDVVLVYPVLIYGPGKSTQGNHITKMIDDYARRRIPGIPGNGEKQWTFSYVDDVAQGHLAALEKGKKGERYILGGEDATLLDLFEMLESLTGVKRPRRKIPFTVAKAFAWVEELRAKMSQQYVPKITRAVVEVYKHHWRYSSYKAITELGYTRTPLKMGLLKTLESLGYAPREPQNTLL